MRKLSTRGASWDSVFLASAKILMMLFGILLAKILSVGLSLEEYGTYSQANLINTVGASLIAFGLSDAVNFFYNRRQTGIDDELRMRIVNTVFFLEIVLGVVLAVVIVLVQTPAIRYFNNDALRRLIPVVAMLPVLSNLLYCYQVIFVSVGKAKLMALFNLIMISLKVVAVCLAIFVLQDLLWIFVALVLLEFGQILTFNWFISRQGVPIRPWHIAPRYIKEIFAYGLPIGVYTLTSSLTRDLDKLVIGRLESTETLAIYSNCSKLLPFDVLVVSFATVLIPYVIRYVTEGNHTQSKALLSSYLKVGYYSVWILATMVLIAPQTVISLLYASEYTAGTGIFILYVFDSMLRFASVHLVLTAANKTKLLMGYSILSLGMNLVLNIGLYYGLGVIGPAVATLICALVYTWLILRQTFKIINASWRDIFCIKEILWLLLTLLVGWAVAFGLHKGLLYLGVNAYIAMFVSMALFGLGMLAMHIRKIAAVLKQINTFRM